MSINPGSVLTIIESYPIDLINQYKRKVKYDEDKYNKVKYSDKLIRNFEVLWSSVLSIIVSENQIYSNDIIKEIDNCIMNYKKTETHDVKKNNLSKLKKIKNEK